MGRTIIVCSLLALLSLSTAAQSPTGLDGPRFEVASVKPNKTATASDGMRTTQDRVTATGNPLNDVIRFAYQIEDQRIIGLPDWTRRERFDISAKIPPSAPGQVAAMMRTLLADRFALKAHTEMRPTKVNVLLKARADGRLGPGLRVSTVDCTKAQDACYERNRPRGVYRAVGVPWPRGILMSELRVALGTTVIDRTGITGNFDIDLEWADPTASTADQAADSRPSLVTALREQLGVKAEPSTEPIEVLVIDSVDRPTPD
jgi:uncharacterized protein (TIGR03435 family)